MAIILGRELTESERKIYRAMDAAMDAADAADAAAEESGETNSVSPRNPHPQSRLQLLPVARRLDFSSLALQEEEKEEEKEVSPISHATLSVASWECAVAFPIWNDGAELELKTESSVGVGECNVCYDSLPARSNHVFTVCGHLFCVKCLLRWWDTSSSCPMCRAEILIPDITNNWVVADDDDDGDDEESIPQLM